MDLPNFVETALRAQLAEQEGINDALTEERDNALFLLEGKCKELDEALAERDQARAEAERLWDELDGHDREKRDPLPWKVGETNGS